MKRRSLVKTIGLTLVMLVVAVVFLFPVYFLVVASLQPTQYMFSRGLSLVLGDTATLGNYSILFAYRDGLYFTWYLNSVLITVTQTVLSLFFSSMAGYALGVYRFRGKGLVFTLMLLVMMIPLEIIMLPLYKLSIAIGHHQHDRRRHPAPSSFRPSAFSSSGSSSPASATASWRPAASTAAPRSASISASWCRS